MDNLIIVVLLLILFFILWWVFSKRKHNNFSSQEDNNDFSSQNNNSSQKDNNNSNDFSSQNNNNNSSQKEHKVNNNNNFSSQNNNNNSSVPPIAFISTELLGTYKGRPLEEWVAKRALETKIVALEEGKDIAFYTSIDLVTLIPDLYSRGVRFFVGAISSNDIQTIKPFLDSHTDDTLLLTTASTISSLSLSDNVFRLNTVDNDAFPLFLRTLYATFGKEFILIYNPEQTWARELGILFAQYAKTTYTETNQQVPPGLVTNLPVVFLDLEFERVVQNIENSNNLTGPIILGDIAAFKSLQVNGTLSKNIKHDYYSMISWLCTNFYNFSYNIFGFPVNPVAVNCLNALWITSDTYLSGNNQLAEQMQSTYGPDVAGYFNSNGDSLLKEIIFCQYDPKTTFWNIRNGSSNNPNLPKYLYLTK